MTKIHTESCPVCEKREFSLLAVCTDNLVSKEKFDVLKCKACGFGFTQDFPSENVVGRYYEASDYISHSDTHKGIINKLYHLVRKISLKSKAKLSLKIHGGKTGDLLDIGAGTGYFLNKMKESGWSVTGIEKAEQARIQAKEIFGINCFDSGYLFRMPEQSEDVITMWHVLEHVENLNGTLEVIYRILRPDGTAIIALPNKHSADARHYKNDWAAYDVPRHLWHFSPADFTLLAGKHGFEVSTIKPMYFDGFYISMLSEQNKGTTCASLVGLIKGSIFFIQSLFNKKRSSSLIYILKKKIYQP